MYTIRVAVATLGAIQVRFLLMAMRVVGIKVLSIALLLDLLGVLDYE